jgi:Amt family ammonium transporter
MVVHGSSGLAALVVCLLIGQRVGYQKQPFRPHNLPFTVLGAGMLWFGWFGFNGGSALEASGLAVNAFVSTNIAAAVAALTWAIWEWQKDGAPTMLGLVTGIIAGLGAITPACGYVRPLAAIPIGILAGVFSFLAVTKLKARLGYDDSLDVFGVHGICGVWGTIATGLFAEKAINAAGANGFLFGNVKLLLIQGLYVAVVLCYSVAVTWILYKFVEAFMGMRVEKKDEIIGLDLTQHHESAYTVVE